MSALLLSHCKQGFESRCNLFQGVAIAENAKNGVIGRKYLIVRFLWTIEPIVGKETLCLFGIVSFEEGIKTGGNPRKFLISNN